MLPLTETQRYQIEHDIRLGLSNQLMAKGIGFSVRTIEREVSRCGGRANYRAADAQAHRRQCAGNSAANHPTILELVWIPLEEAIRRKLSPEVALNECQLGHSASAVYRYLRRSWRATWHAGSTTTPAFRS